MVDATYGPKVYMKQGGDTLVVASGGKIVVETGGAIEAAAGQGSALTPQLTTIGIADAAGTADYTMSAVTQTGPFGFASAQEAITALYVIKNLQTRLAEVEAILEAAGLAASI